MGQLAFPVGQRCVGSTALTAVLNRNAVRRRWARQYQTSSPPEEHRPSVLGRPHAADRLHPMKAQALVARNIRRPQVGRYLSHEALADYAGIDLSQLPSMTPPNRANPTAGTNSGLDNTWASRPRQQVPQSPAERCPISSEPKRSQILHSA